MQGATANQSASVTNHECRERARTQTPATATPWLSGGQLYGYCGCRPCQRICSMDERGCSQTQRPPSLSERTLCHWILRITSLFNERAPGDIRCTADTAVVAASPSVLSLTHISEPTRLLSISYAVFCLKSFSDCRYVPQLRRYSPTNLCDGAQMAIFCIIFASCISSEPRAAHFRPAF